MNDVLPRRVAPALALLFLGSGLAAPAPAQCAPASPAVAASPVAAFPRLNEPAPGFAAVTTQGPRQLADYRGKWLVLFSHPADFTPVCTTEVLGFARAYPRFQELDTELLGLSIDSRYAHIAWIRNIEEKFGVAVPFPIIEDLSMQVARAYGMVHPAASDTSAVRALFVIDPDGILRAMIYYPMTNGRSVDEVLRLVQALQTSRLHSVATPEGWRPGEDVLVPPPATADGAAARSACVDWYFCKKPLEAVAREEPAAHTAVFSDRLEPFECGTIQRLHTRGGIFLASQPQPADLEQAVKGGVRTVINQRHASELDFDEGALVESLGLTYHNPSWNGVEELTDAILDETRALLRTAERPILLHCSSANRVGAVWLAYRVLDEGAGVAEALAEAQQVGLRSPDYEKRVLEYVEARAGGEAASLDAATRAAILEALDDERRAQAFYAAVLARFGERPPFAHIAPAEARHEAHLLALCSAHGIEVPANRWVAALPEVPETFAAACAQAAESERRNAALYDRLLEGVSDPDVRATMEILRDASRLRHLPAFERWASPSG